MPSKTSAARTKSSAARTKSSAARTRHRCRSGARSQRRRHRSPRPGRRKPSRNRNRSRSRNPKSKPKTSSKAAAKPAAARTDSEMLVTEDAVPTPIADDPFSATGRRRAMTARDWSTRSSPVVEILDDPHPIGALRRFLDSIKGPATAAAGADRARLGAADAAADRARSARRRRGQGARRSRARALGRFRRMPHRLSCAGVPAQRVRGGRRRSRRASRASKSARAADRRAASCCFTSRAHTRSRATRSRCCAPSRRALAAGVTPADFRRDHDFAPYATRSRISRCCSRAPTCRRSRSTSSRICPPVRARARVARRRRCAELGEAVELRPPVRLDTILDTERAAQASRCRTTTARCSRSTNGMRVWDREFFGDRRLSRAHVARAARSAISRRPSTRRPALSDCVPLASWGASERLAALRSARSRPRAATPGTS